MPGVRHDPQSGADAARRYRGRLRVEPGRPGACVWNSVFQRRDALAVAATARAVHAGFGEGQAAHSVDYRDRERGVDGGGVRTLASGSGLLFNKHVSLAFRVRLATEQLTSAPVDGGTLQYRSPP